MADLERELQSSLHHTGCDGSDCCDLSKASITGSGVSIGSSETGVIEGVEHFPAELDSIPVFNPPVLDECGVGSVNVRARIDVAPSIAKRTDRVRLKCGLIDVVI